MSTRQSGHCPVSASESIFPPRLSRPGRLLWSSVRFKSATSIHKPPHSPHLRNVRSSPTRSAISTLQLGQSIFPSVSCEGARPWNEPARKSVHEHRSGKFFKATSLPAHWLEIHHALTLLMVTPT